MTGDRLYLDHAATTPPIAEARAAVVEALEVWANPSSPHAEGRAAGAALEAARGRIAEALGWRHDVILTSGASEAIALAASALGRRLIGSTEHDSVAAVMGDATLIEVGRDGMIDLAALESALEGEPALVAIQQVNNETGVIQPLGAIYDRIRDAGSLLLADCAQAAGKIALPDADFVAVSAHKLGGPPGVGALLVRNLSTLRASGGQERGFRRGTQNLPAIAGFATALDARTFTAAMPLLAALRSRLESALAGAGGIVVAAASERSPAIGAVAMPGVSSASQLIQFDLAGIAVSAGSACSSGTLKPSRVLAAMKLDPALADCVIRISFGPATNEAEIDRFTVEWLRMAARAGLRAA